MVSVHTTPLVSPALASHYYYLNENLTNIALSLKQRMGCGGHSPKSAPFLRGDGKTTGRWCNGDLQSKRVHSPCCVDDVGVLQGRRTIMHPECASPPKLHGVEVPRQTSRRPRTRTQWRGSGKVDGNLPENARVLGHRACSKAASS